MGKRVRDTTVTMEVNHFGNDNLIALEPLRLPLLGGHVHGMLDERLQCRHGRPVIHVGREPCRWVLPSLFAQVAGDGFRNLCNLRVQRIKRVVERAFGERESGGDHAVHPA